MRLPLKRLAALTGTAAVLALTPAGYAAAAPDGHGSTEALNIAHRGASATAPENTLAAVREGIAQRGDLIELDVQRTSDGELVLIHDTTLSRTTDVEEVFPDRAPWRVSDFTYEEMLQLDAGSWKSAEYAGERIPTLRDAIGVIRASRAGLLLELKAPEVYPGIEADVLRTMRAAPGYLRSAVATDRLVVQSFSVDSVRRFADLEPDVPVGLLGAVPREAFPALSEWLDQVNPHHRYADASYVAAVHAAGMECLVWTVDSPTDMNRALDLGVDGVITNKPDVLEQVLQDRRAAAAA